MTHPYKLQVKIGTAEFSAEGPEAAVKQQFQQFLDAVSQVAPAPPAGEKTKPPGEKNGTALTPPPADVLQRAYTRDGKGIVSLQILPETENRHADAVLLLLYGFQQLGQLDAVPATQLMDAVQQSGLPLDRVDRTLAPYIPRYILRGGIRRGTRYSLNNQGRNRAIELLAEMHD